MNMENAHLKTNEEFIIPGNSLSTISVDNYSLTCGVKYNTNTIPVSKDTLKKAGAVFINEVSNIKTEIPEPSVSKNLPYTKDELEALNMTALRAIGNKFGVTDNKKSDLIEKILAKEA